MRQDEIDKLTAKTVELAHLLYFQQNHKDVMFAADPELQSYEPVRNATGDAVESVSSLEIEAEAHIAQSRLKEYLCPLLRSTSKDLSDIAKAVVSALVPLSIAHVITLPINPMIYGAIALVIFNSGVASFCNEC